MTKHERFTGEVQQAAETACTLFAPGRIGRDSGADLLQLFEKWGTDKIYHANTYEILLDEKRLRIESVLEIGIGTMIPGVHSSMVGYARKGYQPGGSLRAWRDYFPNAIIIGLDVQPDTQFGEDRIRTCLCDSTSATEVERTLETIGLKSFDLIIDDGSHLGANQLKTLANFFPCLKPSGLYVVEDVMPGSLLHDEVRTIDSIIGENPYFAVPISTEREKWNLIVIKKRGDADSTALADLGAKHSSKFSAMNPEILK